VRQLTRNFKISNQYRNQTDAKKTSSPAQAGTTYRQAQVSQTAMRKHSDSFARTRIDSDNFPSLPGKVIECNVPTGPLDEMDLDEPSNKKLNKREIIQKFKDFKAEGKIVINRKLKFLSIEKFPIICKDGDVRLEELEPTQPTQVPFRPKKK
jgi:hypothetical protein